MFITVLKSGISNGFLIGLVLAFLAGGLVWFLMAKYGNGMPFKAIRTAAFAIFAVVFFAFLGAGNGTFTFSNAIFIISAGVLSVFSISIYSRDKVFGISGKIVRAVVYFLVLLMLFLIAVGGYYR